MDFEILGEIEQIETIAKGKGVRDRAKLQNAYGGSQWLKRRGIARVRLADRTVHLAEVHWYEASGVGRKRFKMKRLLD